jgi:hypothetical protein
MRGMKETRRIRRRDVEVTYSGEGQAGRGTEGESGRASLKREADTGGK